MKNVRNKIKEKDLSWKVILSLESRPISFRSCESTFQSNAHIFSPSPFRWTLNVENANIFSAPEKSHTSKHAIFVTVLLPIPLFVTAFDVTSFFNLSICLWLLIWQMSKWKGTFFKFNYKCSSSLKLSGVADVMHSMPSAFPSFPNSNDSWFLTVLITGMEG